MAAVFVQLGRVGYQPVCLSAGLADPPPAGAGVTAVVTRQMALTIGVVTPLPGVQRPTKMNGAAAACPGGGWRGC